MLSRCFHFHVTHGFFQLTTYFEGGERVRRDIERGDLDVSEEVVKVVRINHNLS